MNYPQARRKARVTFGPEGDARMVKVDKSLFRVTYAVGVVRNRQFIPLGAGDSWEAAFNSVKETSRGQEEGGAVGRSEGGATNEGGGEVGGVSPSNRPATGIHRVKLT